MRIILFNELVDDKNKNIKNDKILNIYILKYSQRLIYLLIKKNINIFCMHI